LGSEIPQNVRQGVVTGIMTGGIVNVLVIYEKVGGIGCK